MLSLIWTLLPVLFMGCSTHAQFADESSADYETSGPGNNSTRGQSAYTMTHPGLSNYLDYPDVASISCPKPALFFNGLQDKLFPLPSIKDAYQKMHEIWTDQNADYKLFTKLWNVKHTFNTKMQLEALKWLDNYMK